MLDDVIIPNPTGLTEFVAHIELGELAFVPGGTS